MKRADTWKHIAAWTCLYIVWLSLFQNHAIALTRTMTVQFCYLIFITADYYVIERLLIPRYLPQKRYGYFVAFTVSLIFISAWFRAWVALQMNRHFFHPPIIPHFDTLFFNSALNISLWVLVIITGKMLFERMQTQKQMELLERERIKNELDYLKAQINPHALFNSLNTIYGNIDKSNNKARDILLQFSELLRYQLYDCHTDKVCLEKEIDYLKNYIAFHKLRKDDNLLVHVSIHNMEETLSIAPLLLVVLIENAFKFVSNSFDKENKLSIHITARNSILRCRVHNTKEIQLNAGIKQASGIGLLNLKRRLELLYPRKHDLTITDAADFYETQLLINLS